MRYKAIVAYDGTNYGGWQKQKNAKSIQQEIEDAFEKIVQQPVKITASGRTDGKVHARGQVFHFDSDREIDFRRAVNSQLPEDIYIRSVEPADEEFHARYSAKWKHYDYLLVEKEYNPLLRNYAGFSREELDLDLVEKAKEVFLGTHDFTSFNATGKDEIEDQIRTIYRIDVVREDDYVRFSFYGDGFLRYMVRMLTAALIEAGLGKTDSEQLKAWLEAKDKTAVSLNSKPQGLYLIEVGYNTFLF